MCQACRYERISTHFLTASQKQACKVRALPKPDDAEGRAIRRLPKDTQEVLVRVKCIWPKVVAFPFHSRDFHNIC